MTKLTIKEHNVETGEVTERPMTEVEILAHETRLENARLEAETKTITKEAVLTKLGLTADEVAALLG